MGTLYARKIKWRSYSKQRKRIYRERNVKRHGIFSKTMEKFVGLLLVFMGVKIKSSNCQKRSFRAKL